MLKINNVKYENITPEIDFTPYELVREGNLNKVNALYITCEEKTFQLDIETTYDVEEMRKLQKNEIKQQLQHTTSRKFWRMWPKTYYWIWS